MNQNYKLTLYAVQVYGGRPIPELNEETLLNGADDWNAYCYGGGAPLDRLGIIHT